MQVSGSRDTSVKLWNRNSAEAAATYSAHALPVTGIAALEQQGHVCSGSRDCTLRLWDIASSAEVSCTSIPQNVVTFMKAVPGEAVVLQAGEDLHLRLWDSRTMQAVSLLPQHSNIPLSCDVSHDGKILHSAMLSIVQLAAAPRCTCFDVALHCMLDLHAGLYFATSCNGYDGDGCEVCLWDRRKLQQFWQWKGHQQATAACIFMPNMCTAASASHVHLCSPLTHIDSTNPAANQSEVGENTGCSQALLEQPANLIVASASADCTVRMWQMGRQEELCMVDICNIQDHSALTSLAFCSAQAGKTGGNNNLLFASNFSGQLQSWQVHHTPEPGRVARQHVSLSAGMSNVHLTHGTASNE